MQSGSLSLCAGSIAFLGNVNLTYTGAAAVTTGAEIPTSVAVLTNLSITGVGKVVTLGSNATVNGTFTMNAGSFLLGSFVLSYGAVGQLAYNGTAAQTTGPEWPAGAFAKNVTIGNTFSTSGLILDANRSAYSGTMTVTGVGFFNSGNFTVAGTGNIVMNAGASLITANANGVSPTGAIQLTGTRTFTAGSSYIFNGTAAQTTGPEMPASIAHLTTYTTIKAVKFAALSVAYVYPNPASNRIMINFPKTDSYRVSLFNSSGEKVKSRALTGNTMWFDVSNLQEGVYFIHVDQTSFSQIIKIVIRK